MPEAGRGDRAGGGSTASLAIFASPDGPCGGLPRWPHRPRRLLGRAGPGRSKRRRAASAGIAVSGRGCAAHRLFRRDF